MRRPQQQCDLPCAATVLSCKWLIVVFIGSTDRNSCLRVVKLGSGTVHTLVGSKGSGFKNGDAAQAKLSRPKGVCVAPSGRLLIADSANHCIRSYDLQVVIADARSFLQPGASISLEFNLMWNDALRECKRVGLQDGKMRTLCGIPKKTGSVNGDAESALFNTPTDVKVRRNGTVIVADRMNRVSLQRQAGCAALVNQEIKDPRVRCNRSCAASPASQAVVSQSRRWWASPV